MNKIKILPPEQAQKIAAGEVVERPANVVKEIIENSADAGSTQVSLYIEKAGKQLIRVVDNGCGMSQDDAKTCFLSHATSKITKIEELEAIESFGFRGEALASISAISKVKLITRLDRDEVKSGVQIEYQDGKVVSEQSVTCNPGTDIQIHDLFYNIPVRKKFLKQDETEWNQVQTLFYAFCLSHVKIHFKLFNDGKLVLNAPPVNLVRDRVTQIWDHNFAANLIELNDSSSLSWIKFDGCISNHNFWRYGRTHIFFFVNNRWVKNSELSKGLLKGYLNVLPPDKFPAAFIFINIDKTLVDVNCHPKKEEVRFIKPVTVQNMLQETVKNTLAQNLSKQILPQALSALAYQNSSDLGINPNTFCHPEFISESMINSSSDSKVLNENNISRLLPNSNQVIFKPIYETALEPTQKQTTLPAQAFYQTFQSEETQVDSQTYKIIGQLFKTYILIENNGNFVIIDQHAAHERVIYEQLFKNFEHKQGTRLLFPEFLNLTQVQINMLLEHKNFFVDQGIDFELIGKNDITIKTSPPKISNTSLKDLFLQAIEFIEQNDGLDQDLFRKKLNEHMHSQIACKSAVKAGDELTFAQMQQLIDDLNKCENRIICVHGRPTTWVISKGDVEKRFKRS